MFEGRGAAEITIFNPALTDIELLTLTTNFNTYRQRVGSIVITCGDQINGVDISLKEMLEATMKQCSMAPAFKTKVGAEGTATISISSRKKNLFKLALNAKEYAGSGADAGKRAYTVGDNSGTRTGSTTRPFKTIVFRPYEQGTPSNDIDDWIIFPSADVEGDATIAFKIGEDRGYMMTATAYDPFEKNYKVIIGDPSIVLSGSIISNPSVPLNGYDIILAIGQSNMVGHNSGYDSTLDTTNIKFEQRPPNGGNANTNILLQNPVSFWDQQNIGAVSLVTSFARQYFNRLIGNRKLLVLPMAQGGTGFTDNRWNPGNDLYNAAVTVTNGLLTNTDNRLVGILWHQGENDTYDPMPKNTYINRLDTMINGLRNTITNALNIPFILGEMQRDWVGADTNKLPIQQAIQETPTRLQKTGVVSSLGLAGNNGDVIHFTGSSARTLGERYYTKFIETEAATPIITPPNSQDYLQNLRFRFDFTTNLNDSSSNNQTIIVTDVNRVNDSQRGFVGEFVELTSAILLTCGINSSYTKTAWIKSTTSNPNQNFISQQDDPANVFWMPTYGRIAVGHADNLTLLEAPVTNSLVINNWYHVAATFSGTNLRMYINGVKIIEKLDCDPFLGSPAGTNIRVGNYNGYVPMTGYIDDARLYNIALTDAQVLQIYNATVL